MRFKSGTGLIDQFRSGKSYAADLILDLVERLVCRLRQTGIDGPQVRSLFNFRLKQISALFAWAIKNDLATVNPAEKLEKLGGGSDGYYTWTDQDVETFEAFWPRRLEAAACDVDYALSRCAPLRCRPDRQEA
jgi:hypothetical protein